jgi:hypothetical protein
LNVSHTVFAPEDNVDIMLLNVIDLSQSDIFERKYINIQALYVVCHILVLGVFYKAKCWNMKYIPPFDMCVCCGKSQCIALFPFTFMLAV